jgi:hypothetical protein
MLRLRPALTVAALLAAVTLSILATWLVSIRTNPRPNVVHSLGVVARFSGNDLRKRPPVLRYGRESGLRVDMLVHVHPTLRSCGVARVDVVVSGTPGFWREHDNLRDGVTQVALGWDWDTKVVPAAARPGARRQLLATVNQDPQAPLHPAFYLNTDMDFGSHVPRVHSYFGPRKPGGPLQGIAVDVRNWSRMHGRRAGAKKPLHFRFTTKSWLERRAFGSCYVNLPTLPANGAIIGQIDAVGALYGNPQKLFSALAYAQPPTLARTVLDVDGELSLGDTTPAPNDFEAVFYAQRGTTAERLKTSIKGNESRAGPVWTCRPSQSLAYLRGYGTTAVPPEQSFSGNACGAVAVVAVPRADDLRGFAVLVLGILIGFFADWFTRGVVSFWKATSRD